MALPSCRRERFHLFLHTPPVLLTHRPFFSGPMALDENNLNLPWSTPSYSQIMPWWYWLLKTHYPLTVSPIWRAKPLLQNTGKASIRVLHYDLRLLLLGDFEKSSRKLKMNYYANGNRAGKDLNQCLWGCRYKSKIPFIIHPLAKDKHCHPKDIADAFSHYYGSLYNLEKNPHTYQPTPKSINNFLKKNVPSPVNPRTATSDKFTL